MAAPDLRTLKPLLEQFAAEDLYTPRGREHILMYDAGRRSARENIELIRREKAAGQDVTDLVLQKLLPHWGSTFNKERGAWIHVAPSITKDIKVWFDATPRLRRADWTPTAMRVLSFVEGCVAQPANLRSLCEEFSGSAESKGLQTGFLTPILNALRPDDFLILNKKSRLSLNHFTASRFSNDLIEYPDSNAALRQLVGDVETELRRIAPDDRPSDIFDIFCHWAVAIKKIVGRRASVGSGGVRLTHTGDDELFSRETFELLTQLNADPLVSTYEPLEADLEVYVEQPVQRLFRLVAERLPSKMKAALETDKRLFSQFRKNDYGRGGVWPWYWAAFYPKGTKRTHGYQLFLSVQHDLVTYGFSSETDDEEFERFLGLLKAWLASNPEDADEALDGFVFGHQPKMQEGSLFQSLPDCLERGRPEDARVVRRVVFQDEAVTRTEAAWVAELTSAFTQLFPLMQLATRPEAVDSVREKTEPVTPVHGPLSMASEPPYPLTSFAAESGFALEELEQWIRAIERKGQAILYGPPGTGKTYAAMRLARHLVGGGDGFVELVQFHPSYSYEEFVQGIRPVAREQGGLDYPTMPGRLLEFCKEAAKRAGRCVLIVDEINRANLSRVFGELMYLLEYRDQEVALAGGMPFSLPRNVRIIGTMNTADRSIALVDHALRRRFAFLALEPKYDVLRKYHQQTGFVVEPLIRLLEKLNANIERHYRVGISFFLMPNLEEELEQVWRVEIEPYLEEYFFDQPDRLDEFRWSRIGQHFKASAEEVTV